MFFNLHIISLLGCAFYQCTANIVLYSTYYRGDSTLVVQTVFCGVVEFHIASKKTSSASVR